MLHTNSCVVLVTQIYAKIFFRYCPTICLSGLARGYVLRSLGVHAVLKGCNLAL